VSSPSHPRLCTIESSGNDDYLYSVFECHSNGAVFNSTILSYAASPHYARRTAHNLMRLTIFSRCASCCSSVFCLL
jgi:hypothetical protein